MTDICGFCHKKVIGKKYKLILKEQDTELFYCVLCEKCANAVLNWRT